MKQSTKLLDAYSINYDESHIGLMSDSDMNHEGVGYSPK